MNLFPAIDLRGGKVVRLTQGDYDRMTVYGEDPCAQARQFVEAGARYLHVVDLDGAKDGTLSNYGSIAALAKQGGLYIEVGGGIRTEERIEKYLSLGVNRCILGSVAVTDFDFTARMLKRYGERIAVGVDAKDGFVAIHGWKEVSAEKGVDFCRRLADAGCTAIIYTDYGVAAYQSGEKEVARELLSYAEELYQSFHEYSQMPIALSYLALFDVEDGQYVSAAARLSKALDVGRKMGSPWWNGITLYITWKIRLLLEKQAINVPELSVLWPQDKRKHCIECLDCLHRLEPRTETAEMEQALEALNAEKAES